MDHLSVDGLHCTSSWLWAGTGGGKDSMLSTVDSAACRPVVLKSGHFGWHASQQQADTPSVCHQCGIADRSPMVATL